MIDILFGQSYYLYFDPKLWRAMQPYPPLGTLYAASYIRSRGYQVALFDAMLAQSEAEWEIALAHYRPRLAVLFEDNFNYLSKMCLKRMRQAAFTMIGMARRYGCQVIVAGSDPTDNPGDYLSQGADFVLLGEGEATLGDVVDHIYERSNQPLSTILGLAYKSRPDHSGFESEKQSQTVITSSTSDDRVNYIRNQRRPELRHLDDLPLPAWDLVNMERYRTIWLQRHGYFSINMVTTRGCPFHCNWCAKPIWGQRYNARSPENVAAELKWLKETYGPDHIWFMDDIFGLQPGWVDRFASAVEAYGIRTPFKSLNRVDLLLRDGEIDALQRAGCQWVWVGAESGSQKILDAMDKGIRVDQIYAATQKLHSAGIKVGFFLQFGYPGESMQDIRSTFQMVRECVPDDIGISVSYPLPGTPFYEMVRAQLGAQRNWNDSSDLAMLYKGPFNTAFYRQLHRLLHSEFRKMHAWQRIVAGGEKLQLISWLRWLLEVVRSHFMRLRLGLLAKQAQQGIDPLLARMRPEEASHPSDQ